MADLVHYVNASSAAILLRVSNNKYDFQLFLVIFVSSRPNWSEYRLKSHLHRPTLELSFGTMNINALVISGSDPGAVPGVSTINMAHLADMGTK